MAIYRFAGLSVDMEPHFPTLTRRSKPYLAGAEAESFPPDIRIRIPYELFARQQKDHPNLSEDSFEYIYATGVFYHALLHFDGMMLHSSAVAYNRRAYLFSAPPGTGKSTHTSGWMRMLGDHAVILNDDKPALRIFAGGQRADCLSGENSLQKEPPREDTKSTGAKVVHACGTPFSGSSPLNANICVPVGGICILTRGTENRIGRLTPEKALPYLYDQTLNRLPEKSAEHLLSILETVVYSVPLWRMECREDEDAVRCSFEAMTGERYRRS